MRTRIARYVRVGAALIGMCGLVALGVWARISGPADGVDNSSVASNQRVTGDELLRQAEERLIKRCMERHGFTYAEQPPPSAAAREFPYVVDDVAWADRYGYGHTREHDVNDGNLKKLPPDQQRAWRQTLIGSGDQLTADIPGLGRISAPDNGCTAEARRNLYGDLTKWYGVRRVVDHLDTYLSNKVTGDPRYRTALVPWAKCVRNHGYRVDTPIDLRLLVARKTAQLSARQAHAVEVAAAGSEARCARSTTLSRTARSLERAYRPVIERRLAHQREVLESLEQQAIPRARHALAEQ